MPDRTIAPLIRGIENLNLPHPKTYKLDNGIPVFEVNMGTQDILKLDMVFHAGRPYEQKQLASRTTAALLKEGTQQYDSATIAEKIDFYGGSFSIPVNLDTANVVLYCLSKHARQLIPLVADIVSDPVFNEKELQAFVQRNQQRLLVDLSRNDIVAYRQFTELIFGESHPYGYNSSPEIYRQLTRSDLITHFENNFHSSKVQLFVSGKFDDEVRQLLNDELGQKILRGQHETIQLPNPEQEPMASKVELPNTVQTAIRIGRRIVGRNHPDYNGLYVLNTLLGGYFGSRLMENIREDKGFTYNIYSAVDMMLYDGYLYVATEVGNEFVAPTLREIYHEFERLQQVPVGEEELNMVRNYLLGNLLTMLDGSFNISEIIKTQVVENLAADHFKQLVQTIRSITPAELQRLAQKYLQREAMWEVIVGV